MSAYLIGQVTVHSSAEYEKYLENFMEFFLPFEGRILVATQYVEVLEGDWPQARTIVLEFPSMEHAKRWYESEGYQKIAQHRFKAASANLVLADGFSASED